MPWRNFGVDALGPQLWFELIRRTTMGRPSRAAATRTTRLLIGVACLFAVSVPSAYAGAGSSTYSGESESNDGGGSAAPPPPPPPPGPCSGTGLTDASAGAKTASTAGAKDGTPVQSARRESAHCLMFVDFESLSTLGVCPWSRAVGEHHTKSTRTVW